MKLQGVGWALGRNRHRGERERDCSSVRASLYLLYYIILEVRGGGVVGCQEGVVDGREQCAF